MTVHWDALAEAVLSEMNLRGWSIKEMARQSGMAPNTVRKLLRGHPTMPSTWANLEWTLCWRKGTVARILTDGPTPSRSSGRQSAPGTSRLIHPEDHRTRPLGAQLSWN